ncbi:hypothetical protein CYMTET_50684 [Cymbomonas tetramitiformis]|uniref:BTB domain-containing protein n=1 Tax=Cymbomonas tetramitiformis TaxID=36881 RepID=A0AAE0BPB0_9CHLO|nr:hypothetical protein CYMTET_50684 [Cymbomonas tetramitiformis]
MAASLNSFKSQLDELISGTLEERCRELDERERNVQKREETITSVFESLKHATHEGISIVVGNTVYNTTRAILLSKSDSFFQGFLHAGAKPLSGSSSKPLSQQWLMLCKEHSQEELNDDNSSSDEKLFIARDGEIFHYVLEYLTYGDVFSPIPDKGTLCKLKKDAEFYRLPELSRLLEDKPTSEETLTASIQKATERAEAAAANAEEVLKSQLVRDISHYSCSSVMTSGYKIWDQLLCKLGDVQLTLEGDNLIAEAGGTYRVVVKVNGASSGANSDHIAIHVVKKELSRALVGSNSGYQNSFHLEDVFTLEPGEFFSVYQQINGKSACGRQNNTLIVEKVG